MIFKRKSAAPVLDESRLPRHVAIVMDGNGRWAQRRGLPRVAGHSAGSETFRAAAKFFNRIGIEYMTVFAFSTENWARPPEEVEGIMALLEKYLYEAIADMESDNIRLRFLGDVTRLPDGLRALIARTDAISRKTDGMLVSVCLNYGGRADIVYAARQLAERCARGELSPAQIDEDAFSDALYSHGLPDPDLLIKPGGELRLSNFLLWQSAYTEFYFTDTLWPDMDERELVRALCAFQTRRRRFGRI